MTITRAINFKSKSIPTAIPTAGTAMMAIAFTIFTSKFYD
jgi:hypothetical protein